MKRRLAFNACLLAVASLLSLVVATAQNTPVVRARVEPDSILIGDRFDLVIEVEKDLVQVVAFPELDMPHGGALELVESLPPDTLARDGRRLSLSKRYRMAAFEEGVYNLGGSDLLFADKNILDTLHIHDSIPLRVVTFQIDSTSHTIFDVKPQQRIPLTFAEVALYLRWVFLGILVLLGVLCLIHRILARKGKGLGRLFRTTPPLPPHEVAIRALETLRNQKLWQNNKHKLYYSGLTDILRTYIAARWQIGAMEMTSDQIIEALRGEQLPTKASIDLTTILRDGDLVKFAKATPEAEQNEADYFKAYYFVEETKPVEAPTPEEEAEKAPTTDAPASGEPSEN